MTSRFPVPWRIVELPNGFAVEDATGKQIGIFCGRAPDSAGHTGTMTMDDARQMALDFAKLPELGTQNSREGEARKVVSSQNTPALLTPPTRRSIRADHLLSMITMPILARVAAPCRGSFYAGGAKVGYADG